jgi:protein-S-isoprenylcysteine O-methyltransferase Ste14
MFVWSFSPDDARVAFGLLASLLVPAVVQALKQRSWPTAAKVAVAVLVSIVGAVCSEWAAGTLTAGSAIVAAGVVFTAAQAHYATWFSALFVEERHTP